jgi:hypothetical protein
MASMEDVTQAAIEAGFVESKCVHPDGSDHLVYDYPRRLKGGGETAFWRLHINPKKKPVQTYIFGVDTPSQRVSFKNAIDFVQRVGRMGL